MYVIHVLHQFRLTGLSPAVTLHDDLSVCQGFAIICPGGMVVVKDGTATLGVGTRSMMSIVVV